MFLAGIYALAAALVLALPSSLNAAGRLQMARRELVRGAELARNMQLEAANRAFDRAGRQAESAGAYLGDRIVLPAAALPVIGDNLRAARHLARAAQLVAAAAREVTTAVAAFPTDASGRLVGMTGGSVDLAPWPAVGGRLERAAALMTSALAAARPAHGLLMPAIAQARDELARRGDQALVSAQRGAAAASLVPTLFGADRPRTWFLVIQNPVELRATGGLIGAFGILAADGGRLSLLRFGSNLDLPKVADPPTPPDDYLSRYGRFEPLAFWQNVNMTPDFPTAARLMAGMWERTTGQALDGVIAVDAVGLQALMALGGPLSMPGVGEVTAQNFLPLVLNDVYVRFPEKAERVNFLMEVGWAVWERLLTGQLSGVREAAGRLAQAAAGKHFLLWVPGEEARLRGLGLTGSVEAPPTGQDHLMVVGQNAAGNKVDYYARRKISYRIDIGEDGALRERLRVRLENGSPASGLPAYILGPSVAGDTPGLNRSYLSVYLPSQTGVQGAWVDGHRVGMESQTEHGLAVVSRFLQVPAGASSTLELSLRRPPFRPGEYRLVVRRQPSLHPDSLRLEVSLPRGFSAYRTTEGMRPEGPVLVWEGRLASDREFLVRFRSSPSSRLRFVSAIGSLFRRQGR